LAPGATYLEEKSIPTSGGPRGSDLVFDVPPGEVDHVIGIGIVVNGVLVGYSPFSEWADFSHGASF
jgi:hypothetical protein